MRIWHTTFSFGTEQEITLTETMRSFIIPLLIVLVASGFAAADDIYLLSDQGLRGSLPVSPLVCSGSQKSESERERKQDPLRSIKQQSSTDLSRAKAARAPAFLLFPVCRLCAGVRSLL